MQMAMGNDWNDLISNITFNDNKPSVAVSIEASNNIEVNLVIQRVAVSNGVEQTRGDTTDISKGTGNNAAST